MIATPGEPDLPIPVPESLHEQIDEELTETDIKRMDVDDQAIQTILLGLPEDVYAAVDSCETAKEIWECVCQMMKDCSAGYEHGSGSTNSESWRKWRELVWTVCWDAAYLQTQLLIAQKEEAGIQLQAEEFDFMAAAGDLDEIEEVNANCILMANLQQASTSGTQHDRAPVYDTDGSAENENYVTFVAPSMVHSGGTVETSSAPNEEIRAHQETVYRNLVDCFALSYFSARLCVFQSESYRDHKIVEPLRIEFPSQEDQFQEDPPEVPMADNRTMAQLLQAPTVGYEDAIVIPKITATNFELKHGLVNLVQNK
nr:Gag-Pol polyprotein [Tanacetum cinerariifolium]